MTTADTNHAEQTVGVGSFDMRLLRGGKGEPLLVLHDDVGTPGWTYFHGDLARRHAVYAPSHPGFGKSTRPDWMRSVRDVAVAHLSLMRAVGIESAYLVGLGLGGWVAAEMATMSRPQIERMVLVGAMGLQPTEGEIADQFLLSGEEYARLGFHHEARFEAIFGSEPALEQNEAWEINREMTARIAWKPYMFSQGLPHLLRAVDVPTLVVWGAHDRIVPLSCGRRYVDVLPNARLELIDECGHAVDLEKPKELAALISEFIPVE